MINKKYFSNLILAATLTFGSEQISANSTSTEYETLKIVFMTSDKEIKKWGLHLWTFSTEDSPTGFKHVPLTTWEMPFKASRKINQCLIFEFKKPILNPDGRIGFIVHKGNQKANADADMVWSPGIEKIIFLDEFSETFISGAGWEEKCKNKN